jgi:cardiolipin synthase
MRISRKLTIAVISAVLTVVVVLLVLNLSLGDKQIDRQLGHLYGTQDPQFLRTMGVLLGPSLVDGNAVRELLNGDEIFPAMLDAIRGAQRTITFETYIYWSGTIGAQFADALAERARAGVKVHVLLDWIGSEKLEDTFLQEMEQAGVQVRRYNKPRSYSIGRLNNRTHRKSLIIDGRVAFTGGAGIADHWRGNARGPAEWRDTQIELRGPALMPLQSGFAQNWQQTTGELISGDDFYPPLDAEGPLSVQTLMSSPVTGASSVRTMYYLSIVCARHSIYIANPYFVPDPVALETLIDAKKRGVDVRVMVSGLRNDNWLARQNSVRLYGRLLAAGIEIQEYNRTMLHQKTMVVDRKWVTIGTTNFDNRSFAHNEESNVAVFDARLGDELHTDWMADLEGCKRLDYASWTRRGLWARAQEFVAAFLQEQS